MNKWWIDILSKNIGPIMFLLLAGGACMLLPMEARKDPLLLVIGAALTRVKRTDK